MKKNKIIKSLLFSIMCASILITTVYASGTAGSSSDPIVTKSYVDAQINTVLTAISNINSSSSNNTISNGTLSSADKKALVEEITSQVVAIIEVNNNSNNSGNNSVNLDTDLSKYTYKPVELQNGQVLIGEEGTEIILRSGTCVSYVMGTNGLANVTTGVEVMNNEKISINNVLIVPRNDGRGVRATDNSTWFIVKGGYKII